MNTREEHVIKRTKQMRIKKRDRAVRVEMKEIDGGIGERAVETVQRLE